MTNTDIQAAIDAGAAIAKIQEIHGIPVAVVPEDYRLEQLSSLLPAPARKTGTAKFTDAQSFVAFVKEERDSISSNTRIYGQTTPRPLVQAVFNDHGKGGAGWRDFVATYAFPLSTEWQTWNAANGKKMSQEEFAMFVEDSAPDFADPSSADMVEISTTLQAKKKVNFASGLRLDNGQNQLTYEETVDGSAGAKGQLKIPQIVKLGIPVFEGAGAYLVETRLRYRIMDGGKLQIWFDLLRPHKIIEHAVNEAFNQIAGDLETTILRGTPASA